MTRKPASDSSPRLSCHSLKSPIKTMLSSAIRAACAEGRQAYWVCTLIDDSDEVDDGRSPSSRCSETSQQSWNTP